uniref:Obg-like ATPase homolog n=1 Tax=Hucho hucho TaxID=62062 RepID=A0A4W5LAN5_9TELE
MKAGIVGLPNVGKSTLFNLNVPDPRIEKLELLVKPERLVKGASKGEGLGNQFLGNIRECNAIIHVLRCFDNDNIVHVDGNVNPIRDKETIDIELQLKDLENVEKRLEKVNRAAKTGNKEAQTEKAFLDRIRESLLQAKSARTVLPQSNDEELLLESFQLITAKPVLYVCNVDENSAVTGNKYVDLVRELVKDEDAEVIVLSVGAEADITELESYEERQVFLEDMGLTEPGASVLIRAAYKLLKQQTYFTAGVKEVRAWTINIGSTAPQAAGVIHTDFEKGFIRAEVIAYEDFVQYGSEAKCKEAGKFKVEGKEYIVKDGDVIVFLDHILPYKK